MVLALLLLEVVMIKLKVEEMSAAIVVDSSTQPRSKPRSIAIFVHQVHVEPKVLVPCLIFFLVISRTACCCRIVLLCLMEKKNVMQTSVCLMQGTYAFELCADLCARVMR